MANYGISSGRGSPNIEKLIGQLMSGLMPQSILPKMPEQTIQGIMGSRSKGTLGQGYNKTRRFGLLSEGKKQFLNKYAGGAGFRVNPTIKPADLLRM